MMTTVEDALLRVAPAANANAADQSAAPWDTCALDRAALSRDLSVSDAINVCGVFATRIKVKDESLESPLIRVSTDLRASSKREGVTSTAFIEADASNMTMTDPVATTLVCSAGRASAMISAARISS